LLLPTLAFTHSVTVQNNTDTYLKIWIGVGKFDYRETLVGQDTSLQLFVPGKNTVTENVPSGSCPQSKVSFQDVNQWDPNKPLTEYKVFDAARADGYFCGSYSFKVEKNAAGDFSVQRL